MTNYRLGIIAIIETRRYDNDNAQYRDNDNDISRTLNICHAQLLQIP